MTTNLNNFFVYYLSAIRGVPNRDFLQLLKTDQVQFTQIGQPIYNPPLKPNRLQSQGNLTLASTDFDNNSSVEDVVTFNQSQSHAATFTVAVTRGITLGAETKVSVGIPFLAADEVTLSAMATLSSTQTIESSDTQTFSTTTQINVPGNSRVRASQTINLLRYTGTVTSDVAVSGLLGFNDVPADGPASLQQPISLGIIFGAVKTQTGTINFSLTDTAGSTFRLTTADVNSIRLASNGAIFTTTANITANFGSDQSVDVKQTRR